MTKSDIIKRAAEQARVPRETAALVIDAALNTAAEAVAGGDTVKVHRFGTLEPRMYKGHIGRNFLTGESTRVDRRVVVVFSAAEDLKNRVRGGNHG